MGGMNIIIDKNHSYYELVDWFQLNVGSLLNFVPIVSAIGNGWSLTRITEFETIIDENLDQLGILTTKWLISIDDSLLGTQFVMIWT